MLNDKKGSNRKKQKRDPAPVNTDVVRDEAVRREPVVCYAHYVPEPREPVVQKYYVQYVPEPREPVVQTFAVRYGPNPVEEWVRRITNCRPTDQSRRHDDVTGGDVHHDLGDAPRVGNQAQQRGRKK